MNGGEPRSQAVKAAAWCVTRSPPLGNDDPSVSPQKRRPPGISALKGLRPGMPGAPQSGFRNVSCFIAAVDPASPPPVRIGKNLRALRYCVASSKTKTRQHKKHEGKATRQRCLTSKYTLAHILN